MSPAARLDIAPEHRRIVLDIIGASLPRGSMVWAFGSRASGRARRYSDLDLAIDAGAPLSLDQFAILREAFSESDLPYRVDIVDWRGLDDRFRQMIAADRLPLAAPPDAAT